MNKPVFREYDEGNVTTCHYTDKKGRTFFGKAVCAAEDQDVKSSYTGYSIAEYRCKIQYAKALRDDAKIAYQAVKQAYYSMNNSKKFNKNSFEARRLYRQMKIFEADYLDKKFNVIDLQRALKLYLGYKDKIAKESRAKKDQKLDKNEKNE